LRGDWLTLYTQWIPNSLDPDSQSEEELG
jgi:hypothetical protein